jgi:hypothetical protein
VAELRRYTSLAQRGAPTLKSTLEVLVAHRERVEASITQWKRALKVIDAKIEFYTRWIEEGDRPKEHAG